MTTGAPTPAYSVQQPVQQPRPRRSRLRTFLPLGFAAWLVLEIWLLSVVASTAGGFALFVLLLAGLVLGAVVIKRAGRRAFQNLNEAIQRGTAPTRGGGNGLMMLGGLLLMIPGLVSDAAGLLLLLPPVQKAVGRYTQRTVDRKLRDAGSGVLGDALQQARIHRPDGKVVQGEVIRDDHR
ncbi:FxsA family membrane protein [Streptomyces sp. NPDC002553]|uniref:FxsA family membrane protein n=1 Tax=Streptomyces sp. NPDC002553 TaxID=3154417 RepID=UPI00332C084A